MTTLSTSPEPDRGVDQRTPPASASAARRRVFPLGIWALAFGYFGFYAPYCALVRVTSSRALPAIDPARSRIALALAAGVATALTTPLIIAWLGWWRFVARRRILGVSVPCPAPRIAVAGVATAVIIYTTTLMYSFAGVSIVLAMLLMRAGVLMLAPAVDVLFKRRVRWFSKTAVVLSLLALATVALELPSYHLTVGLGITVAAYIGAYAVRLQYINSLAKSDDRDATLQYFIEEQLVAMAVLAIAPAIIALSPSNVASREILWGFSTLMSAGALWASLSIGVLYACLYCFGTLLYLDRRENTFCIALNRCASVLAVVAASYGIALWFGAVPPNAGELAGAALIATAMLVMSPLHHVRVRRFEAPDYRGWIVYRRAPRTSPYAVNTAERVKTKWA